MLPVTNQQPSGPCPVSSTPIMNWIFPIYPMVERTPPGSWRATGNIMCDGNVSARGDMLPKGVFITIYTLFRSGILSMCAPRYQHGR